MYAFTSSLFTQNERLTTQDQPPLKPPPSRNLNRNVNVKTATDDKIGKGIDVALVTLTFLGLGYLLDRWLDTKPVFMVVLVCVALIGEFVRFWYDYDSKMKVLEAERAAGRSAAGRGSQQ